MSTSQEIPHLNSMRVLGVCILIISIVQIGVASAAYDLTYWQVGSWWAGMLAFITGILAIISVNRGVVTAGCVLSVLSILICIAGVVFDATMYNTTRDLDFCLNQETGDTYGNSNYYPDAVECAFDHSQTCLCVQDAVKCACDHSQACLCVQGSNDNVCFLFDLNNGDNCGQILSTLPALLLASLIFVAVNLLLVFTYSIFTCISLCSPAVPPAAHQPNPVGPGVIAVATPAGQIIK